MVSFIKGWGRRMFTFMKKYKFKFTSGKIQGPNVSEHCIALLLLLTRSIFAMDQSKNYSRPTEILNKNLNYWFGWHRIGNSKKTISFWWKKFIQLTILKLIKKFIKKKL